MNNIVEYGTSVLLSEIGYTDDSSCEFYACNEVTVKSYGDDYRDEIIHFDHYFREDFLHLGDDEYVDSGTVVVAPHYSDVVQWIFENYKLFIEIHIGLDGEFFWNIQTEVTTDSEKYFSELSRSDEDFKSIHETYDSAIRWCIDYIKNHKIQ